MLERAKLAWRRAPFYFANDFTSDLKWACDCFRAFCADFTALIIFSMSLVKLSKLGNRFSSSAFSSERCSCGSENRRIYLSDSRFQLIYGSVFNIGETVLHRIKRC